jgi:hypothetical protein
MSDHDGHDHDHDHGHDGDDDQPTDELIDLTEAVGIARSGLRSDVQVLVDALAEGELFVPLAEDIDDAPEGEVIEVEKELSFRPHMVLDEDQNMFCVAYTDPDFMEPMREALGWTTSGGELKFASVPANFVLDMALQVIDDREVFGLVINAGLDEELMLRRDEIASIARGQALPLVGYVADIEPGPEETMRPVDGAEPLPEAMLSALAEAVRKEAELAKAEAIVTFNPERDREPHPTIVLTLARHGVDRHQVAEAVMDLVSPHVPEPGYVDIVFRDPAN